MGVTNLNTHICGLQQLLALNVYRYAYSGCTCETLPPHYSYSFAPWLATTRHHHPRCICTASQFSNGDRRHVLAPFSPPQSQHVPPTTFIPSQPAPTPTPTPALVLLDTSEDLPSADTTPITNTEIIMGDATSTPSNTRTESTPNSTRGPGDGLCGIWTMLVQPIWTWIVQTLIAWVVEKVSPQPKKEFTEKLLLQWAELQKTLNEERGRQEDAEKALAEKEKARAVWEEKHRGEVERREKAEKALAETEKARAVSEEKHRGEVERREKAEKALAETEKARAVWKEKHRGEVERREEVVRIWQERFQADEAKADKVKTALEEELRMEREKVRMEREKVVEAGKENALWMRIWQRERERVQDLAKIKDNVL
ncbi:hypothetical protein BGX38DRAFT_1175859 [Terfezia claveryi]|nr:hypothetical protein BGX38DRAFT_1175859 [Terfezia claveryi]